MIEVTTKKAPYQVQIRSNKNGIYLMYANTEEDHITNIRDLANTSLDDVWKLSFSLDNKNYRVVRENNQWWVTNWEEYIKEILEWNRERVRTCYFDNTKDNPPPLEPEIKNICTLTHLLNEYQQKN